MNLVFIAIFCSIVLLDFHSIDTADFNEFFQSDKNQKIVSDRNRYFKFDLVQFPIERNIFTKKPKISTVPLRRKFPQPIDRAQDDQYVWDEYGKFWTYRKRPDPYPDYYNNEQQQFQNPMCKPPFCYPRRCNQVKCGTSNCIMTPRICPRTVRECNYGQKQVLFGSEVICIDDKSVDSCLAGCGENGICINRKCYCKTGFQGDSCSVMDAEMCKQQIKLICAHGCSFDNRINELNCVCGERESRINCIELRVCFNGCRNGGVCIAGKCQCMDGFEGDECQVEIGSCSPGQMGNRTCEQVCVADGKEKFQCKCRPGYQLNSDGRSCRNDQCSGIGTSEIEGGTCKCKIGWKGLMCDEDVNECAEQQICQHECINIVGSYKCKCKEGFKLLLNGKCERSCSNNCTNRGDCLNGLCYCFSGWYGEDCSLDIDECKYSHGCEYKCLNNPGSFVCQCSTGHVLQQDKKRCVPIACQPGCQNGGICENDNCICSPGFTGIRCEFTDVCKLLSPCEHLCSTENNNIICSCRPGYKLMPDGHSCKRECQCFNGRCENDICICNPGYQGTYCDKDVDECSLNIHKCDQICINSKGSYSCSCAADYQLMQNGKSCRKKQCPSCIRGQCSEDQCVCPVGFTGLQCENDINECKNTSLCQHNCTNTVGSFSCTCKSGFKLSEDQRSCVPFQINECLKTGCDKGECINSKCVCHRGFTGIRCDKDVDECATGSVCSQICTNEPGSYKCSCIPGFVLSADQSTCVQQCLNCVTGQCQDGNCICLPGYIGDLCQLDVNECNSGEHQCEHICINSVGTYKCTCRDGYLLNVDGRKCQLQNCDLKCERGTCINGRCVCFQGFQGDFCNEDINECLSKNDCEQLCINKIGSYICNCSYPYVISSDGRSCVRDICKQCENGKCQSDGSCQCNKGFKGKWCDQDINECILWKGLCQHHCVNTDGAYKCFCKPGFVLGLDQHSCVSSCSLCKNGKCDFNGECKCKTGWTGELCNIDLDECLLGTHKCEQNCKNTNGSYECSCNRSFQLSTVDGRSCLERDQKCSMICRNGGRCVNGKCQCKPGHKGDSCEEDINECLLPQSIHGCIGECRNTFGNYECICPPGYELLHDQKTCKVSAKDTMCNPHCLNGGVCRDMSRCYCPTGFKGKDCGFDVDECERYAPCDKHQGICKNTYGSYYCQCKIKYVLMFDGTSCMTIREAILKPHLRYRGRGTKGVTRIIEN